MTPNIANENITAEWARKTAQTELGAVVKKQLDSALERIKEEVGKNKMSAHCYFSMEDLTKQELVKRGFKVNYTPSDSHDPRESDYFTISW